MQLCAIQLQRTQVVARQQRLHVGQLGAAVTEFEDRLAVVAGERKVVQLQVAGQLQFGRRPGLREMQLQVAAEPPLGHGHRQWHGNVGQVARQVQLVELEVHHCFAGIREGLGVAVDAQRAAVYPQ